MIIAQKCANQCPPDDPVAEVRYEKLLSTLLHEKVQGAIVYEAKNENENAFIREGLAYYPVKCRMDVDLTPEDWQETRRQLIRVIGDFSPDLIQCMGAEWPYGLIAESVSVPVAIHLMGFLNAYYPALDMVLGYSAAAAGNHQTDRKHRRLFTGRRNRQDEGKPEPKNAPERITDLNARRERQIMAAVHYFMGRTEWDRNLVKYYAPGAKYYRVEELMKPCIYAAAGQWKFSRKTGRPLRLLTISSGDDRKGNEIILRTALLLKELLKLPFVWRVAGHPSFFERYEGITGIHHRDVNVELIGYIDGRHVVEELKTADLFIHPSMIDNSPHAVCEAQMIGCPVIASNVGGTADLVKDRVTGFLYPYHEPHTLAFLIGNLYQEEEILKSVSARAIQAACYRHDPARIAQTLYQTYEDIIKEYGKSV